MSPPLIKGGDTKGFESRNMNHFCPSFKSSSFHPFHTYGLKKVKNTSYRLITINMNY